MEQKIISKNETQCIYLMKDTNLEFYFIIPNNKQVSIVLGLFSNVTEEMIKNLPKETDKAIVIPVLNDDILTNANHLDVTGFKYLDGILSYLINITYKILTNNNLVVNKKILLNNNSSYENFNNKYIEKYKERVELYNLLPKPALKTANQNIFEPILEETNAQPFKPVTPPFQNVQTNEQVTSDTLEESIEPLLYDEPVIASPDVKTNKEPGFVSYVLLGVLVAIISLVFLYMML